jgi:hypothetical protein
MVQQGVKFSYCILQQGDVTHCCILHGGSLVSLLHFAVGSQILPLHDAEGSQILLQHDAAGSQFGSGESIWQRGFKSKNFGRLPRPLKRQSCKKCHIWGPLLSPSPMRIMY